MKNVIKTLGITAIAALFVFTMTTCNNPTSSSGKKGSTDADYGWYGDGSASDFYISTEKEMLGFARIVNGTAASDGYPRDDFSSKTINIIKNINFSGIGNWTSIGNNVNSFAGTFNGQGNTISDLTINTGAHYQGLFGYITGGVVKNLGLIGVDITSTANCVGAAVGYNNGGRVENCYVAGKVEGSYYVGSVVGWNQAGGTVENCYATGNVEAGGHVGGVVGLNRDNSTIKNCYATGNVKGNDTVGGVVGFQENSNIENCYVTGNIEGNDRVGGVVGMSQYISTVENCYTTGNVEGNDYVGGIVGYNWGTVENCYTTGNIEGNNNVGGIVGRSIDKTVENCFATGNVEGNNYVGGVVGWIQGNSYVTNCYATGNVRGNASVGGVVGCLSDGTVENCISLSSSLTRIGGSNSYFARVRGEGFSSVILINNHAYSEMEFVGISITVTPNANGIHGDNIADAKEQSSWETAGFVFDGTNPWVWNGVEMPSLQGVGTAPPWPGHLQ